MVNFDFSILAQQNNINPDKLYYKIGEVGKLLSVKTSVIRFWESEFNLRTNKSKSNQRLYDKKDIGRLIDIKNLLYNQRFTLEGAKKKLIEEKKSKNSHANIIEENKNSPDKRKILLSSIKNELIEILNFTNNYLK